MAAFRLSERARKFVREVGSIVLGVLIALAAQQAAEAYSWHQKASDARVALRAEVEEIYAASAERVILTPCLNAQLDRLRASLLASGDQLNPVPTSRGFTGDVAYRHPSRLWSETSWQSTVIDQVPSHFTAEERGEFASFYSSLAVIRQLNREELAVNGSLMSLTVPLRLDPSLRAHLLEVIESERIRVNSMEAIVRQQMESATLLFPGIDRVLRNPAWRAEAKGPRSTTTYCRTNKLPLAPMPT